MSWLLPSPASLNETTRLATLRLALALMKWGLSARAIDTPSTSMTRTVNNATPSFSTDFRIASVSCEYRCTHGWPPIRHATNRRDIGTRPKSRLRETHSGTHLPPGDTLPGDTLLRDTHISRRIVARLTLRQLVR